MKKYAFVDKNWQWDIDSQNWRERTYIWNCFHNLYKFTKKFFKLTCCHLFHYGEVNTIFFLFFKLGRFPIVVLTFADEVNEDVLHRRWTQFQALHCSRIFAIKNYNIRDNTPRLDTDTTVVDILYNCCIISDQAFLQSMEESSCSCC